MAVDQAPASGTAQANAHANNVYISWSTDVTELADPNPWSGSGFNGVQPVVVVGTPVAAGPDFTNLSFSGVQAVDLPAGETLIDGSFGPVGDSHPQLVVNQNDGGKVTVGWDNYGVGSTASPPFDELESNLFSGGDAFGFGGGTGTILPATTSKTASGTKTIPQSTQFLDNVSITSLSDLSEIDDMTVTLNAVDQQNIGNLSFVLTAPDGSSITLVVNQINAAAKAITGQGLPNGNSLGVYGFTTGATGDFGINVGTTFDDDSYRNIFDPTTTGTNGNAATDYIGTFQPEFGSLVALAKGGDVDGTWRLTVTNYSPTVTMGVAQQAALRGFSLQFSTGLTGGSPSTIDTTLVRGALLNNYPLAVPSTPNGVGPGLSLAVNNTLGPDSPDEGRIYAAYVIYYNDKDPNGHTNPTSNTDIALSYSDNGGQSWTFAGIVNAQGDSSLTDGYSGANTEEPLPYSEYTFGNTKFQPEIAVDDASGTVVISWRDARDDAANARVATYITTSIDGGNTFAPPTYANPSQTAIDAITGQTVILGPATDNQSGDNPVTSAADGYGNQMGLAVFDGQLYPVWAGNFNEASDNDGTVTGDPLNIWSGPMVIAAGPRIIDSTMGPITYAEAASQSVAISITFDRQVLRSTFVPGDVEVFYHSAVDNSSYVQLTQGITVTPVVGTGSNATGYTQFTVTFDPLPFGASAATYNYTGTYSYLIAPDNGHGLVISSPVESYINGVLTDDEDDQNADGTSDENAMTTSFSGTTPGDVYAVPAVQLPVGEEQTFDGA